MQAASCTTLCTVGVAEPPVRTSSLPGQRCPAGPARKAAQVAPAMETEVPLTHEGDPYMGRKGRSLPQPHCRREEALGPVT